MTEAEALDMAAKAAWWGSWGGALRSANRGVIEALRAHAKTLMENAALKAEIERLRSTNLTDVELEAACHAVGIFLYGPDAERFEKMFDAAMTARTALERIDRD